LFFRRQDFIKNYEDAKTLVSARRSCQRVLQSQGITLTANDIGYERSQFPSNLLNLTVTNKDELEAIQLTATLLAQKDKSSLTTFQENAVFLNRTVAPTQSTTQPKFRSFSGANNNVKKPWLGSAGTPFGRIGPKNYKDGVHAVRKSVKSSRDLPSPRVILEDVLKMAEKRPRTTNKPNSLLNAFIFYFTHDLGK
jgi:Animal haem peroxidase